MYPILLFICSFFLNATNLIACDNAEHSSVLSQYNHSDLVLEAVLLKKNKTSNYPSVSENLSIYGSVRIKVTQVIKSKIKTKFLLLSLTSPIFHQLEKGDTIMVFANYSRDSSLLFSRFLSIGRFREQKSLYSILNRIGSFTGIKEERSVLGNTWAKGKYHEGKPVGNWAYYALSGELQLQGQYDESGRRTGTWIHYFHTKDQDYKLFHSIIQSDSVTLLSDYQFVKLENESSGAFKFHLIYSVGKDTLSEYFISNTLRIQKKIQYLKGQKDGREETFNELDECISSYYFVSGFLDGPFVENYKKRNEEERLIRIEGVYRADKKMDETHIYTDSSEVEIRKEVIKKGKVLNNY